MVHLIFDKVTAIAFGDELNLKMIMAMLSHGLLVWPYDVGINVEIKLMVVT